MRHMSALRDDIATRYEADSSRPVATAVLLAAAVFLGILAFGFYAEEQGGHRPTPQPTAVEMPWSEEPIYWPFGS